MHHHANSLPSFPWSPLVQVHRALLGRPGNKNTTSVKVTRWYVSSVVCSIISSELCETQINTCLCVLPQTLDLHEYHHHKCTNAHSSALYKVTVRHTYPWKWYLRVWLCLFTILLMHHRLAQISCCAYHSLSHLISIATSKTWNSSWSRSALKLQNETHRNLRKPIPFSYLKINYHPCKLTATCNYVFFFFLCVCVCMTEGWQLQWRET